ncbi:hypothetical protein [Sediminibacter sp. Hel_I_10]|uniref:hypothetical protein n=1 Tax=Sediminibacter sp. Hel_I_10 TaxID=1392490 RepID=UPI000479DCB5|nr:hypothetical protein [Sediminibacter sp. Hel_I_10]
MDFGKVTESFLGFFKDISTRDKANAFYIILIAVIVFIFLKQFNFLSQELHEIRDQKIDIPAVQKLNREQGEIVLENEDFLQKMRDSSAQARAAEIKEECLRLKYQIPNCNHVTYWKLHNQGEIIREGDTDRPYFLVMISSSRDIEFDYQESTKLHGGYFYLAKMVKNNEYAAIDDVTKWPMINYGDSKERMRMLGTKSLAWSCVKYSSKEWYFVSFSFDKPLTNDESFNALKLVQDFKRFVKRRE